jgi:hypothetical protein
VNACLKKCLKIAGQCVDTDAQFELNVEILNYYMSYIEAGNDQITLTMLNELISKIRDNIDSTENQLIVDNFNRTINYLKGKAASESSCFHGVKLE